MRNILEQACRLVVVAAILLMSAPEAAAVPASPGIRELVQPDGSVVLARAWGDEWANGHEIETGHSILRDAAGWWRFAEQGAGGELLPTGPVVGAAPAPAGVPLRLRPQRPPHAPRLGSAPQAVQPARAGNHPVIVLLVDFTPSASKGTTAAQWSSHFFGATSSVAHYWSIASHGRIQFVPVAETQGTANDGIVAVTLGYAHPNTADSTDVRNRNLTRDALLAANAFVNFAAYDTDGSGAIDTDELHVFLVVRGAETAYGGGAACGPSVWGHRWCLWPGEPPTVDGVTVAACAAWAPDGPSAGYTQIGEAHCSSVEPNRIATIGISCHELGHDLGDGIPDLYDYDDSSNGPGNWSLMASGSWNSTTGHQGSLPALPDAWSRSFLGAATPVEITTNQVIQVPQATSAGGPSGGVFRILPNPGGVEVGGSGEYFLVENRQRVSYDAALPGHGLLVWRINESREHNMDEGSSQDGDQRLVALLQADGDFDLERYFGNGNSGDAGDPWASPGPARIALDTTPSTRLQGGADSGVTIASISTSSSSMSATITLAGQGGCALVGDADGSGSRTSSDVSALRVAVLGGAAVASPACAALRCDGQLDVTDVILMRRALAGIDSWGTACP